MLRILKRFSKPEVEELAVELKQFDVTEEAIATMAAEFLPLVIQDVEDKEALAKVHAARMTVRDKRCRVEDRRKELVADALKHQRNVNAVAKHITAQLGQIEEHLQTEEDKVTAAKEAARKERIRIEEERMARERQAAIDQALQEEKAKREEAERKTAELEANRLKAEEERRAWEERIRKEQADLKAERKRLEEERRRMEEEQARLQAPENFHTAGPSEAEPFTGVLEVEGKDLGLQLVDPDRKGWPAPEPAEIDAVEGLHETAAQEPERLGTVLEVAQQVASDIAQESDATKILHRCDLIVENLTDMESLRSKDARVLWEGFASDISERVVQMRKHVAQYLNPSNS